MERFTNTAWRKPTIAWPLVLAFLLGAGSLTYSALELRILAFDGADFSYYIVTRGSSIRNFSLYRYSAELMQIPALLSVRLLGFGAMPLTRTILAFSHAWFPVIGALSAVALCFWYRRPQISLGPLLTFGIVSLPIAGLAFSAVPEAIFSFWIVYLIQVYGARSRIENAALVVAGTLLAFTHETAFFLAALLLALAIWKKYWLAIWLQILILAGFVVRVLAMSQEKIQRTTSDTWDGMDPYAGTAAAVLLIMLFSTAIARFLPRPGRIWAFRINMLLSFAAFFCFAFTDFPNGVGGIYNPYEWRMYATSLVTLIAAVIWLMDTEKSRIREKYDDPFSLSWWRLLYASTFVALLCGAGIDYRGTLIWRSELSDFRRYMLAQTDSCVRIPWETYDDELDFWQLQAYSVGKVWALIQDNRVVDKFAYVDAPARLSYLRKDVCAHLHDNPEQIDPGHSIFSASFYNLNKAAFHYSFLNK